MKKDIISRNISLLMEHFGIRNESQLAKQVGMPQTTVNKLISGVTADPRISTLTPIAEYFSISVDTLLSEKPEFNNDHNAEFLEMWIPMVAFDEIIEIYGNLNSLTKSNWPYWYPIPKQINMSYYTVLLCAQQFTQPFDQQSLLIVNNDAVWKNNNYCLVKHLDSNSVNLKRMFIDGGKEWLLALQSELPASEFDEQHWQVLGSISAVITDLGQGGFISMETKNG